MNWMILKETVNYILSWEQWASVGAIATAAAALIGVFTLREAIKQRTAQIRPALFIQGARDKGAVEGAAMRVFTHVSLDRGLCDNQLEYPLRLLVKNVGLGPALEIALESFGPYRFRRFGPEDAEQYFWFALAPSDVANYEILIWYSGGVSFSPEPFRMTFRFTDCAGKRYRQEVEIRVLNALTDNQEFQYQLTVTRRFPLTRVRRPKLPWGRAKYRA